MPRVLIVDDEAPIRGVLARILTREGYDVVEAENGEVAAGLVRAAVEDARPFDLILLDIHMPVMDGITLHKRLTEQAICPLTIIVTGDPHGGRIRAMMEASRTSLLEKPFHARDVIDAVRDALSSC